MDRSQIEVVIDGKVFKLAGTLGESSIQRIATYVDSKIKELKQTGGYEKLNPDYKNVLLALNITEELFRLQDEMSVYSQEQKELQQELYTLKQTISDKDLRLDTANKLVIEYKTKVNELQRKIIQLETRNGVR